MDTIEDFVKKYRNTFVFIKQKSQEYFVEFTESREAGLYFTSPSHGTFLLKYDNALSSIRTVFPESGIYNVGDKLFQEFIRVPERQWKRSPCNSNCIFNSLDYNLQQPHSINYETLYDCFFPKYPTSIKEACDSVQVRGAVALNRKFGITISDTADYNLYYGLNCIGSITNNKITVEYEPLRQEVIDYFGQDLTWKM